MEFFKVTTLQRKKIAAIKSATLEEFISKACKRFDLPSDSEFKFVLEVVELTLKISMK